MIKLNDYLYNGDTVTRILKKYTSDLREEAILNQNSLDLVHCNYLIQLLDLVEHNEFLTNQSNRIHEFYKYMTGEYKELTFAFKGRIKSLIRAEEKFNGYVVRYVHKYYKKYGQVPGAAYLRDIVSHFRDLIAFRIIISIPKTYVTDEMDKKEEELRILYELAEVLPGFMEERGFVAQPAEMKPSSRLSDKTKMFFKDYIEHPNPSGYQSLHVNFYDTIARTNVEIQLRTKDMDDYAEIGAANHFGYEQLQDDERAQRMDIPEGLSLYFDEAYERGIALQQIDLSKVDVDLFTAYDNHLVNDCCGLLYGRLISPVEHLSRYQTDY